VTKPEATTGHRTLDVSHHHNKSWQEADSRELERVSAAARQHNDHKGLWPLVAKTSTPFPASLPGLLWVCLHCSPISTVLMLVTLPAAPTCPCISVLPILFSSPGLPPELPAQESTCHPDSSTQTSLGISYKANSPTHSSSPSVMNLQGWGLRVQVLSAMTEFKSLP
jgi:hypothetical protein